MKIVFVVGSLSGGGAERVVANLATAMANGGDDVSVILIASTKITYEISDKIHIVDCSKKYSVPGVGFAKRVSDIRKAIKKIAPKAVVSFTVAVNMYSILACKGLKTRLIVAERNDPRYDPVGKKARMLRDLLYPLANDFVFQTNGEKEYFSEKIQRNSAVIYNPVNPNIPDPYIGERRKAFVTAVRLEPQKNLPMAIDAFEMVHAKYPEYTFEIYGKGNQKDDLQSYIDNKGLTSSIILKGPSNTLYDDIKDSFAFLLSSNYEGMSNSLIEAMALGLPVISTDHPSKGASDLIMDSENGFLVDVGSSTQMAEKMIQLIENKELYNKISNNAVKIKETLEVNKITNQWLDYIKK